MLCRARRTVAPGFGMSVYRVLFVAPSAYPLGGVAVWLDYLCAGLRARGCEATVALVAGRLHDVARYRNAYPRLPTVPVYNSTGSAEGRIRALASTIRRINPDVIFGVNIVDIYPACQRLRSRYSNTRFKVAMSLHGIAADLLQDLGGNVQGIDALVATNRLACRLATDMYDYDSQRVFYTPYGVNVEAFQGLFRHSQDDVLRVAYVGRLEQQQKRVGDLVPIVKYMENRGVEFRLEIVGDGPERGALERGLRRWINTDRVRFVGALPAEAIAQEVYAHTDVLLVPSAWETGPIVIWEAMAAGITVVTSRYIGSGLEGALEHDRNCLMFDVGDADGAVANLERARDPAVRARLAAKGRQLVHERYSVEKSVESWMDAIHRIMSLEPQPVSQPDLCLSSQGRLDRLLGVYWGETIRRLVGIEFRHTEPGGEWPHTHDSRIYDEAKFWEKARTLDLR